MKANSMLWLVFALVSINFIPYSIANCKAIKVFDKFRECKKNETQQSSQDWAKDVQ